MTKNRKFTCVLYAAHFLCSTACIRQDISATSFCSCKLLWRSDEFVYFPVLTRSLIFLQLWTAVS